MSPKRAFFSLNVDSNSENLHQRITEHHPDGTDSVKVIGTQGHTDFTSITKPFERTVNRVVEDVVKDTGKNVEKIEGDVHYTSSKASSSTSNSNLNVKNKSTRRYLERRYDTSDL